MLRLSFTLLVGISAVLWAAIAHAELQKDMDEEEFRAAGLHKLTERELDLLNRWLGRSAVQQSSEAATTGRATGVKPDTADSDQNTSSEIAQPPGKDITEFGQEQLEVTVAPEVPSAIQARLTGEFRGWDGNTIFRLDNGQVWQQRVGGRYRSPKLTDPEVEVAKGRFGYYLEILSSGRSVGVKRIR
ncbi:MAG: hypothetical protein ACFHXK_12905 [bacterium]